MYFTGTNSSAYILLLLKQKKMLSLHGGFLTMAMYHHRETVYSKGTMMKQRKGLMTHRWAEIKKTQVFICICTEHAFTFKIGTC